MKITFTKAELKAYPKLPLIRPGLHVVAVNESEYGGLYGYISQVRYGDGKETENQSVLDIYVDFDEPEGKSIEETNPDLDGTSISDVIMNESELGFMFEDGDPFYTAADGKVVCPHCLTTVSGATESQPLERIWDFKDGEYSTRQDWGSSTGIRCTHCDGELSDVSQKIFAY